MIGATAKELPRRKVTPEMQIHPIMPNRRQQTNSTEPNVAILFAAVRSIYHHLPNLLIYDAHHDARHFTGSLPVVAHPPCRTWSKYLRHQAKSPDLSTEQSLGKWAVEIVIRNGGVLEQPAGSLLWKACNLPMPAEPANPWLYTIYVEQQWFGYATRKPTWLLIAGVPRCYLPPMPFNLVKAHKDRRNLSSAGRSRTMKSFAEWLCQIAQSSWWQLK